MSQLPPDINHFKKGCQDGIHVGLTMKMHYAQSLLSELCYNKKH
jgi:hypothetical protein